MDRNWGVLYLSDPLDRQAGGLVNRVKNQYPNTPALIFDENERWLPKVQAAITDMRLEKTCICLAAEGGACAIALALAAQLPVEKLALRDCVLFDRRRLRKGPRQLKAVAAFARQNLSLVISRLMLADTAQAEIRRIIRGISSYAELAVWTQNDAGKGWIEAFLQR